MHPCHQVSLSAETHTDYCAATSELLDWLQKKSFFVSLISRKPEPESVLCQEIKRFWRAIKIFSKNGTSSWQRASLCGIRHLAWQPDCGKIKTSRIRLSKQLGKSQAEVLHRCVQKKPSMINDPEHQLHYESEKTDLWTVYKNTSETRPKDSLYWGHLMYWANNTKLSLKQKS